MGMIYIIHILNGRLQCPFSFEHYYSNRSLSTEVLTISLTVMLKNKNV